MVRRETGRSGALDERQAAYHDLVNHGVAQSVPQVRSFRASGEIRLAGDQVLSLTRYSGASRVAWDRHQPGQLAGDGDGGGSGARQPEFSAPLRTR